MELKLTRRFRILRIWYFGKLKYAKKVNRWMKGQIFNDLRIDSTYLQCMMEKYGSENNMPKFENFDKNKPFFEFSEHNKKSGQ